jgi:N-acetylneuraminic acid mutarotase
MAKLITFFIFGLLGVSVYSQPWFEKSNFGGQARHRASSFSIGNYGYIGLGHINSGIDVEFEDFWKYDPATDSWTQIANYPEGECFHATCFVIGEIAYVGTGRLLNGTYSKKFFAYNPDLNSWSPIADLPGLERRGAVGFAINGKGYVGTGQTMSGYVADFYEYNPGLNQWIVRQTFPGAVRTSAVGFTIGNLGYLGTGNTNVGSTNDFYQFNPVTNTWLIRATVGPTTRQEAAGFSLNGLGYIGTGDDFSSGNNYSDMWEYSPLSNTWVQIEDFAGTARRYLTAFTIGSRAYAGTGTNGTNFKDFWMFDQNLSVLSRKMENVALNVYPNPASEYVIIDLKELPEFIDPTAISVNFYSLSGCLQYGQHFSSEKLQIDLSEFTQGVYFYQLKYGNDNFKTGKLIVGNQ